MRESIVTLRASTLAGVHDQRTFLQRDAGHAARHDGEAAGARRSRRMHPSLMPRKKGGSRASENAVYTRQLVAMSYCFGSVKMLISRLASSAEVRSLTYSSTKKSFTSMFLASREAVTVS